MPTIKPGLARSRTVTCPLHSNSWQNPRTIHVLRGYYSLNTIHTTEGKFLCLSSTADPYATDLLHNLLAFSSFSFILSLTGYFPTQTSVRKSQKGPQRPNLPVERRSLRSAYHLRQIARLDTDSIRAFRPNENAIVDHYKVTHPPPRRSHLFTNSLVRDYSYLSFGSKGGICQLAPRTYPGSIVINATSVQSLSRFEGF